MYICVHMCVCICMVYMCICVCVYGKPKVGLQLFVWEIIQLSINNTLFPIFTTVNIFCPTLYVCVCVCVRAYMCVPIYISQGKCLHV